MNDLQQTALLWMSKGIAPIPIMHLSKRPAIDWKMWQNRIPPRKVVDYWFSQDDRNLAVVCGGPQNLAILDFDDINSYHDWRKDMIRRDDQWKVIAAKTYRVRTPRGMHLYLKTSRKENSRKYPDTSIDVRCSGNYTLAPPSIHPTGMKYEAIGSPDDLMEIETLGNVFPEYAPENYHGDGLHTKDLFDIGAQVSITELKSRISILNFVSQFAFTRRTSADGRYWMSRCIHPNHKDRHPSFTIDTVTNRARCLSSRCQLYHPIGLDIIDLYSIMNNTTIGNAIRELEFIYG